MVATLNGYHEGCFHVKLGSKGHKNAHSWSYWATLPLGPWALGVNLFLQQMTAAWALGGL